VVEEEEEEEASEMIDHQEITSKEVNHVNQENKEIDHQDKIDQKVNVDNIIMIVHHAQIVIQMPHQEKEATEEEEDAEERDVHHALKVNKENNADQENKEIDHLEEIIIIKKEVRDVHQEMIGHLEEIMKVKAEHHVHPEKIDHQENMFQGVKKVKAPLLEEVAAADVAVVAVEVTNVALVRTVTRKMANLRKLMLTVVSIDLRKID
jgi:hypothetical protein